MTRAEASSKMAALPRPGSGAANKKSGMKPPINRPTAPRSQSALTCSQARAQSGTTSPAESQLSSSTTTLQQRSPPKTGAGAKRKERDYDVEGSEETNIHVVVRCRGRSEREVRENSGVVLSTDGVRGQNVELSMGPSALSNKTYHFDKVFSPAADQSMIYDEVVMPILDEVGFSIRVPKSLMLIILSRCLLDTIVPSSLMVRQERGKRIRCQEICRTHLV